MSATVLPTSAGLSEPRFDVGVPPRQAARGRSRPARHIRGLDGLRALAVTAVVLYHFTGSALPGGFLGVDVFFVISGYLITRLLAQQFLQTGALSLVDFYRRRARRLLPALFVLLVAVSGAALIWRDQLATVRQAVAAATGYVTNWWLIGAHQSYFVSSGRPSMLQHLWSLAVEEQFYLLWPLLLVVVLGVLPGRNGDPASAAISNRADRLRRVSAVAVVLGLASAALMTWQAVAGEVPYGSDGSRLYYGTDTHSMGLLLGSAAGAWAAARLPARRRRGGTASRVLRGTWASDLAGVCALVGLARLMVTLNEYRPELFRAGFLLASLLAGVLVVTVTRSGSALGAALEWAPLRWLGVRSYGIYLWHWPIAVVTRPGIDVPASAWKVNLLRAALTVGVAAVSYRWIEQPIRTGGMEAIRRSCTGRRGRRVVPVLLTTLATVAAGVLIIDPRPPRLAAEAALQVPRSQGVPSAGPVRSPRANPSAPAVPTGSVAAGAVPARPVPAGPVPAGPVAASPVPAGSVPPLPVASAFGDSVLLGASSALAADLPGVAVDAVEGRQARPLLAAIREEAAAGQLGPVVIVHTGDNGIVPPADLDATLRSLAGARRVIVLTDRVDRNWQDPNNAILLEAAARYRNVTVVDWHALSAGHPEWFYQDGLHLRPAGATAYAAAVEAAVSR